MEALVGCISISGKQIGVGFRNELELCTLAWQVGDEEFVFCSIFVGGTAKVTIVFPSYFCASYHFDNYQYLRDSFTFILIDVLQVWNTRPTGLISMRLEFLPDACDQWMRLRKL